jgi:hypothetical protein
MQYQHTASMLKVCFIQLLKHSMNIWIMYLLLHLHGNFMSYTNLKWTEAIFNVIFFWNIFTNVSEIYNEEPVISTEEIFQEVHFLKKLNISDI